MGVLKTLPVSKWASPNIVVVLTSISDGGKATRVTWLSHICFSLYYLTSYNVHLRHGSNERSRGCHWVSLFSGRGPVHTVDRFVVRRALFLAERSRVLVSYHVDVRYRARLSYPRGEDRPNRRRKCTRCRNHAGMDVRDDFWVYWKVGTVTMDGVNVPRRGHAGRRSDPSGQSLQPSSVFRLYATVRPRKRSDYAGGPNKFATVPVLGSGGACTRNGSIARDAREVCHNDRSDGRKAHRNTYALFDFLFFLNAVTFLSRVSHSSSSLMVDNCIARNLYTTHVTLRDLIVEPDGEYLLGFYFERCEYCTASTTDAY